MNQKRISKSSYILPEHEQEAIDLIRDNIGDTPNLMGSEMAVKLYIIGDTLTEITKPDGTVVKIAVPETVKSREVFRTVCALVVALGPECYVGEKFNNSGPYCRVGDWIIIPRNEGKQIIHKGIPMHIIHCEKIYGLVKEPRDVYRKR